MFNVFIQLIRCGKINGNQVLINGFPSVGLVAILGGIAQLFGFMRYPVISILPDTFSDEIKKGIAVSFYVFWGAVYGQALGGSLSQSCVSTA
jgi:DNA helicase TIP49 (TBP-interacting protein)